MAFLHKIPLEFPDAEVAPWKARFLGAYAEQERGISRGTAFYCS